MDLVNRTFVGIRLPAQITQQIEQGVMALKRKPGIGDMRWNPSSELLISLCAFGELQIDRIAQLRDVLRPVCQQFVPMTISIQGFGGTPNMLQPRYAVANLVGDAERLGLLADALWRAAETVLGPRDAQKPFQPHIVLGRLKTESEPLRVALGRALKTADPSLMGVIEVRAAELLISNAGTNGISYSVVDQFPLLGA